MQAALTGGTLQLERALDEKERELQLQRAEIHGLREHLRAVEAAARSKATPSSAGRWCGGGGDCSGWKTRDIAFIAVQVERKTSHI